MRPLRILISVVVNFDSDYKTTSVKVHVNNLKLTVIFTEKMNGVELFHAFQNALFCWAITQAVFSPAQK